MVVVYSTESFSLNEPLCNLGMSSSEQTPLTTMVLGDQSIFRQALKDTRQKWFCQAVDQPNMLYLQLVHNMHMRVAPKQGNQLLSVKFDRRQQLCYKHCIDKGQLTST